MEADETKKQGRITWEELLVQILRFACRFRAVKLTSLSFSAITQNKIPRNLLITKRSKLYTHEIFTCTVCASLPHYQAKVSSHFRYFDWYVLLYI